MKLSIVVAAARNNAIGKDNRLLWKLPNDMKFFKNTTWAMPVIMGRKTFESLGKPLVGRTNIVLTRQADFKADGVIVAHTWEEALDAARSSDALEAFVIGGGEIYQQCLPLCQRIYMTRVDTAIEGDTFFPVLPADEWTLFSKLNFPADEKHRYPYSFEVWNRIGTN